MARTESPNSYKYHIYVHTHTHIHIHTCTQLEIYITDKQTSNRLSEKMQNEVKGRTIKWNKWIEKKDMVNLTFKFHALSMWKIYNVRENEFLFCTADILWFPMVNNIEMMK